MKKYLWEIQFRSDIGVKSIKVVSSKRSLESITKIFNNALKETGFEASDYNEIVGVEYLGETYVEEEVSEFSGHEQIIEKSYYENTKYWENYARQTGGIDVCDDETGELIFTIE